MGSQLREAPSWRDTPAHETVRLQVQGVWPCDRVCERGETQTRNRLAEVGGLGTQQTEGRPEALLEEFLADNSQRAKHRFPLKQKERPADAKGAEHG